MALFEELKERNIIAAVKHLLLNDTLELRHSDGKLLPCSLKTSWNTPWVHHRSSYRHNCFLWKDIAFDNIICKIMPAEKRFVPRNCQGCYKVVAKPKTLKQLFQLEIVQYGLDHASKCGIEPRYSVFGMYGGYWYNRGLDEGIHCYNTVREAVNNMLDDGENVTVMLKRGCTEMEHAVGPSDQWTVTEEQENFEALIEQRFVMDIPVLSQSRHVKDYIRQKWIEEAWKIGDETVNEYIDAPIYAPYVTYHDK